MEPIAPILLEIIYFADSSNFIIFIERENLLPDRININLSRDLFSPVFTSITDY